MICIASPIAWAFCFTDEIETVEKKKRRETNALECLSANLFKVNKLKSFYVSRECESVVEMHALMSLSLVSPK